MMRLCVMVGVALLSADSARAEDPIRLFNGKDLTNWYTFLATPSGEAKPLGKNQDPRGVFRVHDGMIHVSGEVYGTITTEKEHENYRIVVEYKWGEKTWPPRVENARDSGLLVHCTGPDGALSGAWMESIEANIIEGGTGDILAVDATKKTGLTAEVKEYADGKRMYEPGGQAVVLDGQFGRIDRVGRDPAWKDVLGFRGAHEIEKPAGEWNTLEVECRGDTISVTLNGTLVNRVTRVKPARGKIQLQSEGAEIFFRRVDLYPLGNDRG